MNLLVLNLLLGYVGPGAGLTMLGALVTVVMIMLLALIGPILYPIKLFRAWRHRRSKIGPITQD
jgi:hypothetical protein